jgi:hypothetical protein
VRLTARTIEFDGSPEELEHAQLRSIFERETRERTNEVGDHTLDGRLPDDVREWLVSSVPRGETRKTIEAFLTEALSWEDVEARRGSGVGERYMRLYRRGTGVGALVYVHARRMDFRLRAAAASGREYARARDVVDRNPHQVTVSRIDASSLEELLSLARAAYEEAA